MPERGSLWRFFERRPSELEALLPGSRGGRRYQRLPCKAPLPASAIATAIATLPLSQLSAHPR